MVIGSRRCRVLELLLDADMEPELEISAAGREAAGGVVCFRENFWSGHMGLHHKTRHLAALSTLPYKFTDNPSCCRVSGTVRPAVGNLRL